MCQTMTASLRAVATAETCLSRSSLIRMKMCAQRAGRARDDPRRFDEHRSRVGSALFGDAAVIGRLVAGLPDPRVKPKIAHELFGRRKPMDVADGRQYAHRDGGVDAGIVMRRLTWGSSRAFWGEALIHLRELGAKAVEFFGMANDDAPLVLGEWLSLQPSPPAL